MQFECSYPVTNSKEKDLETRKIPSTESAQSISHYSHFRKKKKHLKWVKNVHKTRVMDTNRSG